jgi:hypothetical protein
VTGSILLLACAVTGLPAADSGLRTDSHIFEALDDPVRSGARPVTRLDPSTPTAEIDPPR